MEDISTKKYFKLAQKNYLCNTSYPLSVENWNKFKTVQFDLFEKENHLSFYIHIPFCIRLCSFCEYIKYPIKNSTEQKNYINILKKDIIKFINEHNNITLYGFDIGGGTLTALNDENFKNLMVIYSQVIKKCNLVNDFEPSIEGTFETLTSTKIKLIKNAGIDRISLGLQTTNNRILKNNNRNNGSLKKMQDVLKAAKKNGIKKINIDLMYGLKGQTKKTLKETLKTIEILNPEQVTLYEMRYNMLSKTTIDKNKMYRFYKYIYKKLINMGYYAFFGQNTFSKDINDKGLSSYLRYRMIHNISYKGFGISAQSKSKKGISYNIGKNKKSLKECLIKDSFENGDNYLLDKQEMLAKYIAISLYYGKFNLDIMSEILNLDALEYFEKELKFLKNKKIIKIKNNIVSLTKKGFKYYGAVGALFYSENVKKWILKNEK